MEGARKRLQSGLGFGGVEGDQSATLSAIKPTMGLKVGVWVDFQFPVLARHDVIGTKQGAEVIDSAPCGVGVPLFDCAHMNHEDTVSFEQDAVTMEINSALVSVIIGVAFADAPILPDGLGNVLGDFSHCRTSKDEQVVGLDVVGMGRPGGDDAQVFGRLQLAQPLDINQDGQALGDVGEGEVELGRGHCLPLPGPEFLIEGVGLFDPGVEMPARPGLVEAQHVVRLSPGSMGVEADQAFIDPTCRGVLDGFVVFHVVSCWLALLEPRIVSCKHSINGRARKKFVVCPAHDRGCVFALSPNRDN